MTPHLSVAYQRLDTDVPLPSSVISGVPSQFDELVERATARDPANRYADAQDMGAELDAIVDGVAPSRISGALAAQFGATSLSRGALSQVDENRTRTAPHDLRQPPATRPPLHQPTRQLTRDPQDEAAAPTPGTANSGNPRQFAGIDLIEFAFERQHARRMMLIWIAIVLSVTGMVAAAAWTVGSNVSGLL